MIWSRPNPNSGFDGVLVVLALFLASLGAGVALLIRWLLL